MSSSDNSPGSTENEILTSSKTILQILQAIGAIGGALLACYSFLKTQPILGTAGIAIVALSISWFLYRKYKNRQKAIEPNGKITDGTKTKEISRNLLSFEEGDTLLGRDNEIRKIITVLDSSAFKFGYVIGDAGVGKTSLLQAGVIPDVRNQLKKIVIFVPRAKINPNTEILKSIIKAGYTIDLSTSLNEAFKSIFVKENKDLLLIIDQFEEFFISHQTVENRKSFIKEIVSCIRSEEYSLSMLISLRKEFVDDLNDFYPEIEQPTDRRFRIKIENWSLDEAEVVLKQMVDIDGLRFSPELRTILANDLATNGLVRPVELQIVVGQLKEGKIYELKEYKIRGRAHQILTDYIKNVIHPDDAKIPESEVIVCSYLLRLLCNKGTDTKRTEGLSISDLKNLIKEEVIRSDQWKFILTDDNLLAALTNTVNRCYDAKIIVNEDSTKYNLAHDYIVQPIRDATKDIETLEEQANRILGKYIETNFHAIPFRQYKFIKKFSTRSILIEPKSKALLSKARRRLSAHYAGYIAGSLILLGAITLLTTVDKYRVEKAYDLGSDYVLSENHNVLTIKKKDSLSILDLTKNIDTLHLKKYPFPFRETKYSKDGMVVTAWDSTEISIWKISPGGIEKVKTNLPSNFKIAATDKNQIVGFYEGSSLAIYDIDQMKTTTYPLEKFFPNEKWKYLLQKKIDKHELPQSSPTFSETNSNPYYIFEVSFKDSATLIFKVVKNYTKEGEHWTSDIGEISYDISSILKNRDQNFDLDSLENNLTKKDKLFTNIGDDFNRDYSKFIGNSLSAEFLPQPTSYDSVQNILQSKTKFAIATRNELRRTKGKSEIFENDLNTRLDSLSFVSLGHGAFKLFSVGSVLVSNDNSLVVSSFDLDKEKSIQVYKINSIDSNSNISVRTIYLDFKDTGRYNYVVEKEIARNKFLITISGPHRFFRDGVESYLLDANKFDSIKYFKLDKINEAERHYAFYLLSPDQQKILSYNSGLIRIRSFSGQDNHELLKYDLQNEFTLGDCFWSKNSDYLYIIHSKDLTGGYFEKGKFEEYNIHDYIDDEIRQLSVTQDGKILWVIGGQKLYRVTKKRYLWGLFPITTFEFPQINYSISRDNIYPWF
jgi:hypothetical protein